MNNIYYMTNVMNIYNGVKNEVIQSVSQPATSYCRFYPNAIFIFCSGRLEII